MRLVIRKFVNDLNFFRMVQSLKRPPDQTVSQTAVEETSKKRIRLIDSSHDILDTIEVRSIRLIFALVALKSAH